MALRRQFSKQLEDDPPTIGHLPIQTGMLSYAGGGKNTRDSHMWFAIEGKSYMGHDAWEPPVGKVVKGISALAKFRVTERNIEMDRIRQDSTFTHAQFPVCGTAVVAR